MLDTLLTISVLRKNEQLPIANCLDHEYIKIVVWTWKTDKILRPKRPNSLDGLRIFGIRFANLGQWKKNQLAWTEVEEWRLEGDWNGFERHARRPKNGRDTSRDKIRPSIYRKSSWKNILDFTMGNWGCGSSQTQKTRKQNDAIKNPQNERTFKAHSSYLKMDRCTCLLSSMFPEIRETPSNP